jgi:hypothetical protein
MITEHVFVNQVFFFRQSEIKNAGSVPREFVAKVGFPGDDFCLLRSDRKRSEIKEELILLALAYTGLAVRVFAGFP